MQIINIGKTIILLLGFIAFFPHTCIAQNNKIDSLKRIVGAAKEDSNKVNALIQLSDRLFKSGKSGEARNYNDHALILSKKLNFIKGEASAYYNLGNLDCNARNYPEALRNYEASLKIRKEIADNHGIALILNGIGILYKDQGNYTEALKYHYAALKLREEGRDKQGMSSSYNNLGVIFERQGNYTEALKIHLSSLKIGEEIGNREGIAASYTNIGNIYGNQANYAEALKNFFAALRIYEEIDSRTGMAGVYNNIGIVYFKQGNYTETLKNYFASLKIREAIGDKHGTADTYNNIGVIYNKLDNYPEAIKNHLAALKIREAIGDRSGIAYSYINIGEVHVKLNKRKEAREYFEDGLAMARQVGSKKLISEAYKNLTVLDSIQSNYKGAYENSKMHTLYRDSIMNNANTEKIARLQMQYGFDKKEDSLKWQQQLADTKYKEQIIYAQQQHDLAEAKLMRQALITRQEQEIIDAKLKEQLLITRQQQQSLLLKETELIVTNKDKMLKQLEIDKGKSEIAAEKISRKAESDLKQGEFLLLNKEHAIQNLELNKQKQFKNYLITGLILVIFLSVVIYRNYRIRQNLRLQTLRNKIASDLHDDLGSTLSSISIFSQMAQQQSKEVIPLLETIGESSRKMLDAMADIVWTINSDNDQFEKIILRMRGFAYELLGAKGIDFEFIADEQIEKVNLPMNVRKNLYLIFKEATNNMAKYSEADKAIFSITDDKNSLVMLIQDNGKGFNIHQPAEGNGLKNMKKRAEEIGAKLLINSDPGKGTSLLINLAV